MVVGNTGLPTGDASPSDAFLAWRKFSQEAPTFPIGGIVNGKVSKIANFGAFIELSDEIDGLVHVSQLAEQRVAGRECVVTGGLGTIAVRHKGETYWVCCTGCREAFEADPEAILAELKSKAKKGE